MSSHRPAVIVTTIFPPNEVMAEIAAGCVRWGWDFLVAGDAKGPETFSLEGAEFFSLEQQRQMGASGRITPQNSYTRKNVVYSEAMRRGAPWIRETDDDNFPLANFWDVPDLEVRGVMVEERGWVNVMRFFSERYIYPRGYPSEFAEKDWDLPITCGGEEVSADCQIQQALADGNPDVDARFRMKYDLDFEFKKRSPVILGSHAWCPFNSQATTWFPAAYPLMYLPATCTFRMTDIWRSFIARRILRACEGNLSFHSPNVFQDRNEHNLQKDFEQELPGYENNRRIIDLLDNLTLPHGWDNISRSLEICYETLLRAGLLQPEEEPLLSAWLSETEIKKLKS